MSSSQERSIFRQLLEREQRDLSAASKLWSALRNLKEATHDFEMLGLAGISRTLSGLHAGVREVIAEHDTEQWEKSLELFEFTDPALEVAIALPEEASAWVWDEERWEWANLPFDQLPVDDRSDILRLAREHFVAQFGEWFVQSGLAQTPDEAGLLLNSVSVIESCGNEIETEANITFHDKRQAMLFKLRFAGEAF